MLAAGYFYWDANLQKQQAKAAEQLALEQKSAANAAKERADSLRKQAELALEKIKQQDAALRQEKVATQEALDDVRREEQRRRAAEQETMTKRINDIKTLINVGDTEEAKRLLKTALETAPNDRRLLELKSKLQ